MNHYFFSYEHPHKHFIDVDFTIETRGQDQIKFQLPSWRPGRYELGNFAKNIQKWGAFDENGKQLLHRKINKDCWIVHTKGSEKVTIAYNYYANQLDAGSTYLDENQLYVNPVNCCLYVVGRENEECIIELDIPEDYQIACGLQKENKNLYANSFDQLAESPFIASNTLQHDSYEVHGIPFHLWFQGSCTPPFKKIKTDFQAFTQEQIDSFGGFPEKEYHFLFQITPYKSYHGVEHTNSTVILLGSEDDVFEKRYDDLLGISSHELYHTWNIKAIRPAEMFPYDYTKENYSQLGYVAEGVTTYMGDIMLHRTRVFNWDIFIKTQNENLKRHFENDGRHNLSVADSSLDTWLDGYQIGIPNRKTSIYTEGALNMLMIDLQIIKNSKGTQSLHEVMKKLYVDFALKGKGYTEEDFQQICVEAGGLKVAEIFNKHIYGTEDYSHSLKEAFRIVGLKLKTLKNPSLSARYFGFMTVKENEKTIVKKMQNNSIADINQIAVEDEIISVNGKSLKEKRLNDLLQNTSSEVTLQIKKKFSIINRTLSISYEHYPIFEIQEIENPTEEQLLLRKIWIK